MQRVILHHFQIFPHLDSARVLEFPRNSFSSLNVDASGHAWNEQARAFLETLLSHLQLFA